MNKPTQDLPADTAVLGWWKPFQDCILAQIPGKAVQLSGHAFNLCSL